MNDSVGDFSQVAKSESLLMSCQQSGSMSPSHSQRYRNQHDSAVSDSSFHLNRSMALPITTTNTTTANDSEYDDSFIKLDEQPDAPPGADVMADLLQQSPDQDMNQAEPQMLISNVHSMPHNRQQVGTISIIQSKAAYTVISLGITHQDSSVGFTATWRIQSYNFIADIGFSR